MIPRHWQEAPIADVVWFVDRDRAPNGYPTLRFAVVPSVSTHLAEGGGLAIERRDGSMMIVPRDDVSRHLLSMN